MSSFFIPAIILLTAAAGIWKGRPFSDFTSGAKTGFDSALKLLPTLAALTLAVSMFRASGAAELLSFALEPVLSFIGVPKEAATFVLLRPISGSASLALLSDIYEANGADSSAGFCASVILGSTDTIFFTLSVYFSSVGKTVPKKAAAAALFSYFISVLCSGLATMILF